MKGILLDENFSPILQIQKDKEQKIISGFCLGDITRQNQSLILMMHNGELKENPAIGVGISDILLEHQPLYWKRRIREQLELDGQEVDYIHISKYGIKLSAKYLKE